MSSARRLGRDVLLGDQVPPPQQLAPQPEAALHRDRQVQLYCNRARYYDPQIGRFVSEDPAGLAGGMNPYAFAETRP